MVETYGYELREIREEIPFADLIYLLEARGRRMERERRASGEEQVAKVPIEALGVKVRRD